MYATISADIVSSTTLSIDETIALKKKINDQFVSLSCKFPGFWGRLIKGDYIECLVPNPSAALRIALILKTLVKSFDIERTKKNKQFLNAQAIRSSESALESGTTARRLVLIG